MINPEVDLELSINSLSAYNVPRHIIANMINNLDKIINNGPSSCSIIDDYENCDIWKKNSNGCSDCKYK